LDFEKTRLSTLKERSASLEALIQGDRRSLSDLEEKRDAILADLEADETKLQELRTQLKDSSELLDQRTKELEEVKREHAKVAKSFDKLLKEISAKVSFLDVEAALFISLQNDDIEKLGVSRSSIYRKCHLESIALPLLKGNLNIVLTEEVKLWHAFCTHCLHSTQHREAVDMDVDGVDKELEPRAIPDYGIEVDFDELDDEDRTVSVASTLICYYSKQQGRLRGGRQKDGGRYCQTELRNREDVAQHESDGQVGSLKSHTVQLTVVF
jgi:structural maintenance of chromosome 1